MMAAAMVVLFVGCGKENEDCEDMLKWRRK